MALTGLATKLQGIGGEQHALGVTTLMIEIRGVDFVHTFHVLPESCRTPNDGIIGVDFLKTFDAIYDLRTESLRLQPNY